ncbi:hypothetical protein TYRP_016738 [Tyrophagus putrescentiae]|nr:hypothetical protein TYRP_016738 [Tyrophagus putrescentiae]
MKSNSNNNSNRKGSVYQCSVNISLLKPAKLPTACVLVLVDHPNNSSNSTEFSGGVGGRNSSSRSGGG